MKAMVLEKDKKQLILNDLPLPKITDKDLLVRVLACAVCRTDLHILDRELPEPNYPLILGHQIVGIVERMGSQTNRFRLGDRIGAPWLGYACGSCPFCVSERENLCDFPQFTGYTRNGGYAEYAAVHEDFAFSLPNEHLPEFQAPLLCAGFIGYRAFKKALPAEAIGFYGFGSSAHLLIQAAVYLKKKVYVFTKPGDSIGQAEAKAMGAAWSGSSLELPPHLLDAAIIFASAGELVPQALKALKKGGRVVCAGIHMSDIPSFSYEQLWEERSVESVANLTREDGREFLSLAKQVPIKTSIQTYRLEDANRAIQDFREGKIEGSAVLVCNPFVENRTEQDSNLRPPA